MKNITLSAQEELIAQARHIATEKHSTLNEMFREWLQDVTKMQHQNDDVAVKLTTLWKKTNYLQVGRKLSREAMNER